jgi:hypothetical protein
MSANAGSEETRRSGDHDLRAIFAVRGNSRRSYHSNGNSLDERKASLMLHASLAKSN